MGGSALDWRQAKKRGTTTSLAPIHHRSDYGVGGGTIIRWGGGGGGVTENNYGDYFFGQSLTNAWYVTQPSVD